MRRTGRMPTRDSGSLCLLRPPQLRSVLRHACSVLTGAEGPRKCATVMHAPPHWDVRWQLGTPHPTEVTGEEAP
jgi:hypothetical protein